MIYSCFDSARGEYDYFEDSRRVPINADLPVPNLPPDAGRIGVAAIEAGRPLPTDARRIGRGWNARGMVVQCGHGPNGSGRPLGASDATSKTTMWFWLFLTAGAVFVLMNERDKARR